MCEMNKVDFPNENRPPVRSSDPAVAAAARHAREHMAQEAAHKTAPANAPEARPQHKPAAHKAEPEGGSQAGCAEEIHAKAEEVPRGSSDAAFPGCGIHDGRV